MTSIGVLPASISIAHAQSPVAAKCNATGNISLDDRIAGCTVVIETATAMLLQSVIFACEHGQDERAGLRGIFPCR
jgi:hypothetical protein